MKHTDKEETMFRLFEAIHQMSMSDDDGTAVTGRFIKRFFQEMDDFETAEAARGIHRGVIIGAMTHAVACIMAVSAHAAMKPGSEDRAKDGLIELFSLVVKDVFDAQNSARMERKNTG